MSAFIAEHPSLIFIISVCAMIISVASMIVSIVLNAKQINRNKNTVRPMASFVINDYKDKITVRIDNVGTGSLTIQSFYVEKDGREYASLNAVLPEISCELHYTSNVEGKTIPIGGSITLLEIIPKSETDLIRVKNELSRTTLYVDYTNIYDNKYSDKRTLDFLGREAD